MGNVRAEVLVQTTANTIDADGQIDVGSVGVDFLEMGNGIKWVMPVHLHRRRRRQWYHNELGHVTIDDDLELAVLEEAGDTVVFESVNSIDELTLPEQRSLVKRG